MIDCRDFVDTLHENGVELFTGVPDSLLANLCRYLATDVPPERNIIAANEGGAIGIATGFHLATNKYAAVYMQNSGEGNAANPLASLTDPEIYSIPMLLVVGWRGEPGKKDEPQHVKQGKLTISFLDLFGIPSRVLPADASEARKTVAELMEIMKRESCPVALVIKKDTFEKPDVPFHVDNRNENTRESAIEAIVAELNENDVVVSTTGHISRELYEIRERRSSSHSQDFLVVGSMGHASQIALGIALAAPDKRVVCLDGDGAAIMHLGGMAIIGTQKLKNYRHIILNNGAHGSVGGQPTAGFGIELDKIALGCGYRWAKMVSDRRSLERELSRFLNDEGPSLLEVRVNLQVRADLGRPKTSPMQNKSEFMKRLKDGAN